MIDLTANPDFFKMLFDNMQVGIIVSDAEGIILYINETYAKFLNLRIEDSIGKHVVGIIPNSRLHIVAKTGQAEINHPHKFNNSGSVVHRVPIRKEGKVVAVLGMVLFDSATTAVRLAEKLVHLESKLKRAQNELASLHATRYSFNNIICTSFSMQKLKDEAIKAAQSELSVLVTGESGTGKELFAQAIHRESVRRTYPFVRVNCAAIPKELFESELFGYEKGAFSGADAKGKAGKFELAHMGTIFLDEIGDMPLELQPKLLRVLELKEFERVGGNRLISSDFRVIAATNQDLSQLMKTGQFRRDLYFRLNGIPINIAPLRNRPEDISCLTDYFLNTLIAQSCGRKVRLSPMAYHLLEQYSWPGNGRELLHALERAVFSTTENRIKPGDLPDYLRTPITLPPKFEGKSLLKAYMRNAERQAISQALLGANQNKTVAAEMLGIHRTLLYRKMQQLGLGSSDVD